MNDTITCFADMLLLDDGTLDTVFRCAQCGEVLRFDEVPRDEHGAPTTEAFRAAEDAHECPND